MSDSTIASATVIAGLSELQISRYARCMYDFVRQRVGPTVADRTSQLVIICSIVYYDFSVSNLNSYGVFPWELCRSLPTVITIAHEVETIWVCQSRKHNIVRNILTSCCMYVVQQMVTCQGFIFRLQVSSVGRSCVSILNIEFSLSLILYLHLHCIRFGAYSELYHQSLRAPIKLHDISGVISPSVTYSVRSHEFSTGFIVSTKDPAF